MSKILQRHPRVHICEQWPLLHSLPPPLDATPPRAPHRPHPDTSVTPHPTAASESEPHPKSESEPHPKSEPEPHPKSKPEPEHRRNTTTVARHAASALADLDRHPTGHDRPPSPPAKTPSLDPPTGATVDALRAHFVGRFERLQQVRIVIIWTQVYTNVTR